mmetsp:Transcript_35975/g.84292  ORF Transcript_35975/g.84292 Transcript_35975/m.84292 type:complete len:227 (+) Transcript_35975:179-859(+)
MIPSGRSASSVACMRKPRCMTAAGMQPRRWYNADLAAYAQYRTSMSTSSHSPAGSRCVVPLRVMRVGVPLYLATAGFMRTGIPTSSTFSPMAMAFTTPVLVVLASSGQGPPAFAMKFLNMRTAAGGDACVAANTASFVIANMATTLQPGSCVFPLLVGPAVECGSCVTMQRIRGKGHPLRQHSFALVGTGMRRPNTCFTEHPARTTSTPMQSYRDAADLILPFLLV